MKKFLVCTTVVIGIAAAAGYYTAKKMALFVTDEHDYDEFEA
ncbi:methanol dehydrogenase [Lacticaseibacillus baoqingensis]|uniref:Methanol dehydrogenase n=1 Tax=Lacticaseibacillus baoqingensis TaxID=2486013 RepID=A0ABW4E6Q2_9LACO|nr:methanol dehydrogenase [Lacticaseibacillus baoqingensis]